MTTAIESLEPRQFMSAAPIISAAQKQNLQKLATDLETIHSHSNVTTAEVSALVTGLQAVAAVATKPDPAVVTRFTTDLKSDLAAGPLTAREITQLNTDWSDILISANVPVNLQHAVQADINAILVSSNVTAADMKLIAGDLTAILNTFMASH
jgi:hypothetical protein